MLTRHEQINIAKELLAELTQKVFSSLAKVPEECDWDGWEIRQLIADKAADECRPLAPKRNKAYKNAVRTLNL